MSIFDQQGLISHNTSAYSPRASESIPDMYCGYEHFCHAHRDVMITATFSLIYKKRMVNAAMLPVIFGFTYFFAYVLLDMNIHIANHIKVLFCIMGIRETKPRTAKFGCCAHLVPFSVLDNIRKCKNSRSTHLLTTSTYI